MSVRIRNHCWVMYCLVVLFFCFEMISLLNADDMILRNSRNGLKPILLSVGEVQIVKFRNITSCDT